MEQAATVTVATLIATVTKIFTASIGWVGTVATTIVNEPLLLMFCVLPLVGLGVGLFRRLLHV